MIVSSVACSYTLKMQADVAPKVGRLSADYAASYRRPKNGNSCGKLAHFSLIVSNIVKSRSNMAPVMKPVFQFCRTLAKAERRVSRVDSERSQAVCKSETELLTGCENWVTDHFNEFVLLHIFFFLISQFICNL
jgi:hypothetical protein